MGCWDNENIEEKNSKWDRFDFFIVGWWVLVIYSFVTLIFFCYNYNMCESVFKSFIYFIYDYF